jgi:hypothetical protein
MLALRRATLAMRASSFCTTRKNWLPSRPVTVMKSDRIGARRNTNWRSYLLLVLLLVESKPGPPVSEEEEEDEGIDDEEDEKDDDDEEAAAFEEDGDEDLLPSLLRLFVLEAVGAVNRHLGF